VFSNAYPPLHISIQYPLAAPSSPHAHLLRLLPPHPLPHLPQTLTHKQYPIDQQPICRALDLEIAEEGVGAEEGEDLVEGVVGLVVAVDVELGGAGGEGGEGVGGAAGAGAEGEEGEVAYGRRKVRGGGV